MTFSEPAEKMNHLIVVGCLFSQLIIKGQF